MILSKASLPNTFNTYVFIVKEQMSKSVKSKARYSKTSPPN